MYSYKAGKEAELTKRCGRSLSRFQVLAQEMRISCQHALKTVVGRTNAYSRIATSRACHSDASSKDLEKLFKGNQGYREHMSTHHPNLLEQLAREGQRLFSSPPGFQIDVHASLPSRSTICNVPMFRQQVSSIQNFSFTMLICHT